MNFLAHLYLSGDDDEVKLGNFCGDFLKGNSYRSYPDKFQTGVQLHRSIDSFTDSHPIVKNCKLLFAEKFHKYSGVVIDLAFDHFLSQSWPLFSSLPLSGFIEQTHEILATNIDKLPRGAQKIIPNFIQKRWIETYASTSGLELVFSRMSIRTSLPSYPGFAIKVIRENYNFLLDEFINFFLQIIKYVNRKYETGIVLPNNPAINDYLK
ncbi:MAG: DUF479 domain-containing protein [Bacteroidetes bacterium]|nr:DUF479 domain-containing protein [Bacteroidota bacterium]